MTADRHFLSSAAPPHGILPERGGRKQDQVLFRPGSVAVSGGSPPRLASAAAAVALCALLFAGTSLPAMGLSVDDFINDPEYRGGKGLDSINAAEAYVLGFSGKGVTVGVIDSPSMKAHREFAGKASRGEYVEEYFITYTPEEDDDYHGVHSAGTVAATRGNGEMHGVAYDAKIVFMVALDGAPYPEYENPITAAFEKFSNDEKFKDVSIINNSWGEDYFLADYFSWKANTAPGGPVEHLLSYAKAMAPLAASGTLLIFSSGNESKSSPNIPTSLPSIVTGTSVIGDPDAIEIPDTTDDENLLKELGLGKDQLRALSLNMISVAAFDPSVYDADPENAMGRLDFIGAFSNMADGAGHYTLLAPGVGIYSSVGPKTDEYKDEQGTSMAAPHVSGAAALVKEAFPWMDGKQLADTLLSTATHPGAEGLPPFLVQLPDFAGGPISIGDDEKGFSVTIPETLAATINPDIDDLIAGNGQLSYLLTEQRKKEIASLYNQFFDEDSGFSKEEFIDELINSMDSNLRNRDPAELTDDDSNPISVHVVSDTEYLALFGMGIVNAGAAVRGPGWLDANRLSGDPDTGDLAQYVTGSFAMYGVDTGGHDSVWSNDVGEVMVGGDYPNGIPSSPNQFNAGLENLHVGLLKAGEGKLTLSGANGYLGPTVVEEGEIALGMKDQQDGGASLAGGVIVGEGAAFGGNGYVGGSLSSEGTVIPGLIGSPGSKLTVRGALESRGVLRVIIHPDGTASRLVVRGDADIDGTAIEFSGLAVGATPALSYEIIEAASITGDLDPASATVAARQGATLSHAYGMDNAATGTLRAVYAGSGAIPQAKALSEGYLGGALLVNQAADLAAGQGVNEAVEAAGRGGGSGFGSFAAISAGQNRYNSGSHVDVSSLSLMAGLSWGGDTAAGRLTAAAFFEFGTGSYDTFNSFGNSAPVRGDGDVRHAGGGALARMDFNDAGPGRLYAELSGRAGRVRNEYKSGDLKDPWGRSASYDSNSAYYGIHAGLGFVWTVSDRASFDTSLKYFWTRQEGNSLTLSTGETLRFEDADSSRLRLGGRFSYAVNDRVSPYFGVGWEHEFDGRVSASSNGYPIDSPSLRGDTGIGELGLALRPSPSFPLFLDLGVQGYVGKRQGATGGLQIRLEF
ncbi:MAG: S8 family serine peptidase [Deltaproteobacteria bacterium]|jgi:outer membrane autotransporter protein|nr:S8 family serine peptidase [Deltaproteobacteria bacterium]